MLVFLILIFLHFTDLTHVVHFYSIQKALHYYDAEEFEHVCAALNQLPSSEVYDFVELLHGDRQVPFDRISKYFSDESKLLSIIRIAVYARNEKLAIGFCSRLNKDSVFTFAQKFSKEMTGEDWMWLFGKVISNTLNFKAHQALLVQIYIQKVIQDEFLLNRLYQHSLLNCRESKEDIADEIRQHSLQLYDAIEAGELATGYFVLQITPCFELCSVLPMLTDDRLQPFITRSPLSVREYLLKCMIKKKDERLFKQFCKWMSTEISIGSGFGLDDVEEWHFMVKEGLPESLICVQSFLKNAIESDKDFLKKLAAKDTLLPEKLSFILDEQNKIEEKKQSESDGKVNISDGRQSENVKAFVNSMLGKRFDLAILDYHKLSHAQIIQAMEENFASTKDVHYYFNLFVLLKTETTKKLLDLAYDMKCTHAAENIKKVMSMIHQTKRMSKSLHCDVYVAETDSEDEQNEEPVPELEDAPIIPDHQLVIIEKFPLVNAVLLERYDEAAGICERMPEVLLEDFLKTDYKVLLNDKRREDVKSKVFISAKCKEIFSRVMGTQKTTKHPSFKTPKSSQISTETNLNYLNEILQMPAHQQLFTFFSRLSKIAESDDIDPQVLSKFLAATSPLFKRQLLQIFLKKPEDNPPDSKNAEKIEDIAKLVLRKLLEVYSEREEAIEIISGWMSDEKPGLKNAAWFMKSVCAEPCSENLQSILKAVFDKLSRLDIIMACHLSHHLSESEHNGFLDNLIKTKFMKHLSTKLLPAVDERKTSPHEIGKFFAKIGIHLGIENMADFYVRCLKELPEWNFTLLNHIPLGFRYDKLVSVLDQNELSSIWIDNIPMLLATSHLSALDASRKPFKKDQILSLLQTASPLAAASLLDKLDTELDDPILKKLPAEHSLYFVALRS